MTWGGANRPAVSNKLGIPHRSEGNDGDIQIRQTNLGAKLFGKLGGRWSSTFLSSEDEIIGTSGTKIGMNSAGTFTVNQIDLTGKITLKSTGTQNICIGTGNSDVGTDNVSVGINAGNSLTSPSANNVCVGTGAGASIGGGDDNVCIGTDAGAAVSGTGDNVFIGTRAGESFTGTSSILIGRDCARNLTSSTHYNTIIGAFALPDGVSSQGNVIVGWSAGDDIETGDYNTHIGPNINANASDVENEICLGYLAHGQGSNTIRLGNASISDLYCNDTGISAVSDIRIKNNIENISYGLDFINLLRPVSYQKKHPSEYPEAFREIDEKPEDWTPRTEAGLISQEVKESMDSLGIDFDGHRTMPSGMECIKYISFISPLIKAVQELSAKVDTMQTEINNLK